MTNCRVISQGLAFERKISNDKRRKRRKRKRKRVAVPAAAVAVAAVVAAVATTKSRRKTASARENIQMENGRHVATKNLPKLMNHSLLTRYMTNHVYILFLKLGDVTGTARNCSTN